MTSSDLDKWKFAQENKTQANINDSLAMLSGYDGINERSRFSVSGFCMRRDQTFFDVSASGEYSHDRSFNDSAVFNNSVTLHPEDFTRIGERSKIRTVVDLHEPWKSVTEGLFMDFCEAMLVNQGEAKVFNQISDFIRNCSNSAELMERMMETQSSAGLSEELLWLQNEKNIWCLVDCLYKDRIMETEEVKNNEMLDPTRPLNEEEVVHSLYRDDAMLRQCQLVIDWLEKSTDEEMKTRKTINPEAFTDRTIGWENTLHQLQNQEKGIPYASSQPIVGSMDPDAPLREQKPLHDLDQEDEVRLARQIFLLLRCGQLERAQALCCLCGQEWRAATLDGWRVFNDPNYLQPHVPHTHKIQVDGNPNRDLWKLIAWRLAEDERMPPFVRASYGMLCGHSPSLLNVCYTWKDQLWARLRCSVDVMVEAHVRAAAVPPDGDRVPLPDEYWRGRMSPEQVFAELASSHDARVRNGVQDPYNVILKCLVLERFDELMKEANLWINGSNPQSVVSQAHMLRFLAHFVLVLRQLGCSGHNDVENFILRAYVKELMKIQDPNLVAFYVSVLPRNEQVEHYAAFLETIVDIERKNNCLLLAEKFQLDVDAITKCVVENIRNRESKSIAQDLQEEITSTDLEKVKALDFLVFFPSQRAEAIWQGNAIIRHFLAGGKLEGANLAFAKIPADSIKVILEQYQAVNLENEVEGGRPLSGKVPRRIENSIREYFCLKAYLEAQESFSDWFQHYHVARPKEPTASQNASSFTKRVALEQQKDQYNTEMERWNMAVKLQSKTVKLRLYNVLLFPEGWLIDVESTEDMNRIMTAQSLTPEDEEKRKRWQQMKDLRELYIPQVVLLLHTVMQCTGELTECMKLAEVVVSEKYQLYKVYTKEKFNELLSKITETSLTLLKKTKDPWGLPSAV